MRKLDIHCKRMKLDPYLTPYAKNNSKCVKYLNVRPEGVKLLIKNIGKKLPDIGLDSDYFEHEPKAQETKAKIGK